MRRRSTRRSRKTAGATFTRATVVPLAAVALLTLVALVGVAAGCGDGASDEANGAAAEAFGETLGGSCAAPQLLPGPGAQADSTVDGGSTGDATDGRGDDAGGPAADATGGATDLQIAGRTEIATFAAGCFWGVEANFEAVPGVVGAVSGYTGGTTSDPTYEDVLTRTTGHAEAVRVEYDPDVVSYRRLVETFFAMHDPTTKDRQGPDVGDNYRSAIFFHTPEQERIATTVRDRLERAGAFDDPIVTEIEPAGPFWRAEDYHQDYYRTSGAQS